MNLRLTRFAFLPQCTLGWLVAGTLKFATIERPWLLNTAGKGGMPKQSCVPDGLYEVRPHDSDKFPGTYILDSPSVGVYAAALPANQAFGRTAILIHSGNVVDDVIGCIAIGTNHTLWTNPLQHAVLSSQIALKALRDQLGRMTTHQLLIRPHPGTTEISI